MDWSSVFEETGDEAGEWERTEITNRLEPGIDNLSSDGKYNLNVMYAFTINYILGVGALGVPYAFENAGVFLGTIIMIFTTLLSWITVLWVAEASYRGMQLIEENERTKFPQFDDRLIEIKSKRKKTSRSAPSQQSPLNKTSSTLEYSSMQEILNISHSIDKIESPIGRDRADTMYSENFETGIEPEVIGLALAFLGPIGKYTYQISLMCLTYAGLLAYAQVFQQTITSQVFPNLPEVVPITIFACIVVPLSCFDLNEQITIQIIMFFLRFIVISLLILGTVFAIFFDPFDSDTSVNDANNINWLLDKTSYPYISKDIPTANYLEVGAMFSTALFSQLFQHSVPGLIRPLSHEEKAEVPYVFGKALITTAVVYIILGIITVMYFGQLIKGSISLNFVNFTWGISDTSTVNYKVSSIFSTAIVLFPALDTLSIFPLIANTLGNNLNSCFPNTSNLMIKYFNFLLPEESSKNSMRRRKTILWRLIASIPPIVLSAFVTDISLSLQIAGMCGIIVSLVIPALLQKYSKEKIQEIKSVSSLFLLSENPYTSRFSENGYVNVVLFISLISLAICLCQIIMIL